MLLMRWGTQRRANLGVWKYPAKRYTGMATFIYSVNIFKHWLEAPICIFFIVPLLSAIIVLIHWV